MINNQNIINYEVNFSDISKRIKQLRRNAGYTQEILSEYLGYSPSYIYQVEAGLRKLSVSALTKISMLFNVSLDYLITGHEKSDDNNLDILLRTLTPNQRENIYTALISIIEPLNK